MLKKFTCFALVIMAFQCLQAQSFTVKGLIKNPQDGKSVSQATVTVKDKTDSTAIKKVVSDSLGRFSVDGLASDTFTLEITAVNYATYLQKITVEDANKDLGIIEMTKVSQVLEGVTVTTNISPVTQKGDTLQMNANQYKVNPDATTEDLVKKMPGITIENGVVKAQGEEVKKVTLDGRELFGDDATAALRNLPAEIVDKIQVFDRLSDQAQFTGVDDGNTSKGLNIITKANMRNGQFGRVFAGYGTDQRYSAGGNTTLLKENRKISFVGNFNNVNQQNFATQDLLGVTSSGGRGGRGGGGRGGFGGGGNNFSVGQQNGINRTNAFGVNYTDNWGSKVVVTGSYFYNNAYNTSNEQSRTEYFLDLTPTTAQNTIANSTNTNHRVNLRFEYKIDSANQLIITPSVSLQKNSSNRTLLSGYLEPKTMSRIGGTRNENLNNQSGNNLNNSILFRHSFAKRGRTFSINLNTSSNSRSGDLYTNVFDSTYTGTGFTDSASRRFTDQSNSGYNVSANLNYTEPISKSSQIQINYSPGYSKNKADQEGFQYEPGSNKYSIFDPSVSNKFTSINTTQGAGLTYRYGNRNNQFNIGADYQHKTLNSDRDYPMPLQVRKSFDNIVPNAMLRLKLNAQNSLNVFYRVNTNLPSVTQLQDAYDKTRLPFISVGNPQLEQQVGQFIGTRYTFTNPKKGMLLSGNIFLQTANNYITNATYTAVNADSVLAPEVVLKRRTGQLTKAVNLDGYLSFRSFLNFSIPLKLIKSNLNMNGGVTYSKQPGLINKIQGLSKSYTYNLGAVIGSNVSQYIDFTVSYSANFNRVRNDFNPANNSNYFTHVASVQLNLLSKKGWFFQNDFNNQLSSGLSDGYNQNYFLWNMSAGKKFLKNQRGELKATVFDLLNQNQSISVQTTGDYFQQTQSQVLQQYFLLTFTYTLRNFGQPANNGGNRWGGGGFGGGRPGGYGGPPRF